MSYSKVTAIMDLDDFSPLENALKTLSIPGLSISRVRGFGDYVNYYQKSGLSDSVKVEIYATSEQAEKIALQLSQLGESMTEGGGLVAIEPVSKLMNVKKLKE